MFIMTRAETGQFDKEIDPPESEHADIHHSRHIRRADRWTRSEIPSGGPISRGELPVFPMHLKLGRSGEDIAAGC